MFKGRMGLFLKIDQVVVLVLLAVRCLLRRVLLLVLVALGRRRRASDWFLLFVKGVVLSAGPKGSILLRKIGSL